MVKIHGSLWAILGIFIAGYSWFIQQKAGVDAQGAPNTNMIVFMVIGILFLVWGAYRLTSDYLLNQPKPKKQELVGPPGQQARPNPHHHTVGSPHATHQHVRPPEGSAHATHQHTRPAQHPSHHAANHALRHCPRCHGAIPQQVRFCPHCGMRFF